MGKILLEKVTNVGLLLFVLLIPFTIITVSKSVRNTSPREITLQAASAEDQNNTGRQDSFTLDNQSDNNQQNLASEDLAITDGSASSNASSSNGDSQSLLQQILKYTVQGLVIYTILAFIKFKFDKMRKNRKK